MKFKGKEYSEEDYDIFDLEADDICMCGHRRDSHNYEPTEKISGDSFCNECDCYSWNIDYYSEFILPYKRLFWKLFKGYKTPMVTCISRRLKPFTQSEIEEIKRLYCKDD